MITNVIDRNNEEIIWKIERTIVLITLSKELRSGNVKYQAFEKLGTLQNERSSIQNDLRYPLHAHNVLPIFPTILTENIPHYTSLIISYEKTKYPLTY